MTPTELSDNLSQFIGTEHWHRFSPLFPKFLLTDGTKYLAEKAGAYWLMDAIASHVRSYKSAGFAIVTLKKKGDLWVLRISDDDPGQTLASQVIEFSDFPLDEIKLYVIDDGTDWTILLPSEY